MSEIIRDERPDSQLFPAKIRVDQAALKLLISIASGDANAELQRLVLLDGLDKTARHGQNFRDIPEACQMKLSIGQPESEELSDFVFDVVSVSSYDCQVNFVLLRCSTESMRSLSTMLNLRWNHNDMAPALYAMIIEPCLFTEDTAKEVIVQAIAGVEYDGWRNPTALGREAIRQLLSAA